MRRARLTISLLGLLLTAICAAGQLAPAEEQDTYAIYSMLLNGAEDQPQRNWVFNPETTGLPSDSPCAPADPPPPEALLEGNAHLDIHPPEDQLKRFRELLDDFDRHCHDTFRLKASLFKTNRPVRVLTEDQAATFGQDLAEGDPKTIERHWPGASGLHSFSRVYFNSDRTVAMVHESTYCGILCGTWEWQVLERTPGGWRVLRWNRLGAPAGTP